HAAIGLVGRLGQRERRLGAHRARAVAARRARAALGLLDLLHEREAACRVAVALRDLGQPQAGLQRAVQRLRVLLRIALVVAHGCRARRGRSVLLLQLGGLPQRIARTLRVLVGGGHALELAGGPRPLLLLQVGGRELGARLRLQRVVGVAAAEVFEAARRGGPVLEFDQRGGSVVLRGGAHAGLRRGRRHALEGRDGQARVAGRARGLALLVDGGGQTLGQLGARRIALGRERKHLGVGALRVLELAAVEGAVAEHGPGRAAV